MSREKWDPFSGYQNKDSKKQKDPDNFTIVAIKFLLGTGVGFSLVCMGFIFFFLALIALSTERYETPSWLWFILGVFAELIGFIMMYTTIKGSPTPGTYPSR